MVGGIDQRGLRSRTKQRLMCCSDRRCINAHKMRQTGVHGGEVPIDSVNFRAEVAVLFSSVTSI